VSVWDRLTYDSSEAAGVRLTVGVSVLRLARTAATLLVSVWDRLTYVH
jgi:hypothetical protein